MPVSVTENAMTVFAAFSISCSGFQPPVATLAWNETLPRSVNLNAFDSRFLSTCCSRLVSVWIAGGSAVSSADLELQALEVGHLPEGALHELADLVERHAS